MEDKATQISAQPMPTPRPPTTSEQKGIRPRGLSLKDRPDEIARSEMMPEVSSRQNHRPQTQERPQNQPTITQTPAPTQIQRPLTKPITKSTDMPLPLPMPNRQLSKSPPPPKPPLHVKSHTNPTKPARTKFNLLNPMSLLARRRSSQAVAEASRDKYYRTEETNVPPLRLPDNYDPRIRGKVIHDFDSAPRSARSGLHSEAGTPPKSANGQEPQLNSQYIVRGPTMDEDSPSSTEKEHTPVFKEHFDDGADSWQEGREGPMKRPKSGFMYKVALQEPGPRPDPSSLPAFARNLPSSFPTDREPVPRVASPPRPPLEVVLEAALCESLPKNPSIISSPPTSPPLKARSRASSATDSSFIPAGLPKHFKSNASRFSFDLAGVGSTAQEQLLEDKHRQKAKEKARLRRGLQEPPSHQDIEDDEGSNYGEDMMDDDGLEEKIPGVNADAEDESMINHVFPNAGPLAGLPLKTTSVNPISPVSESLSSPDVLRHHYENGIEHTTLVDERPGVQNDLQPDQPLSNDLQSRLTLSHNIFTESEAPREVTGFFKPLDTKLPGQQIKGYDDEDDMYFDDGMIEDMEEDDSPAFDESQFDDETSRVYGVPIRDLPKAQPLQDDAALEASPIAPQYDVGDEFIAEELRDSLPDLNQPNRPVFSQTAGLTQDNLAAYHDALAFAANQAALNGKFVRQQSVQSQNAYHIRGIEEGPDHDPIPVGESPSLEINGLPLSRTVPTNDDYDFDDALSDDPIIAEANAEALENDDEGFYGQEFGFFARANGAGEYANGGYFGQGIMRSHSGHNAEPALTPITERSEWSNRNSAINLAMHGYSQVSLPQPSPGIAQLADMMHLEEDNMSLSALMKLRRGAWGSSTTSLQSSSANSGSPLTYLPSMASNTAALPYQHQQQLPQGSYPPVIMQQGMGNSTYSLASSNGFVSDDSSASDHSHTITLQNLPGISIPSNTARSAPYIQTTYSNSGSDSSPVQSRPRSGLVPISGNGNVTANGRGKGGHSRHGSGSGDRGSVSYVHERDGDGERWVLEKRRIGEGGLVEVLGREVVEGGRI